MGALLDNQTGAIAFLSECGRAARQVGDSHSLVRALTAPNLHRLLSCPRRSLPPRSLRGNGISLSKVSVSATRILVGLPTG